MVAENTQYTSKNLKFVRPIIQMYRELENGKVEIQVTLYTETDQTKATLFEKMEKENAALREKLEEKLKSLKDTK